MRIIGIDPGMAIVGYSILDVRDEKIELISSGSIQTANKLSAEKRLAEIYSDLVKILKKFKPEIASVEKLFYFKNQKTIIPVAEARGIILLTLEQAGIKTFEYTPMEVKLTLTGYGRAKKDEVAKLVSLCLNTDNIPKLDDTVDSIAIAICHLRKSIELRG